MSSRSPIILNRGRRGLNGAAGPSGPETGRFGPGGLTITDWNDAINNGYYSSTASAVNSPSDNSSHLWSGHVTAHNESNLVQELYRRNLTTSQDRFEVYRRRRTSGVWGTWMSVSVVEDMLCQAWPTGNTTTVTANQSVGFTGLSPNISFALSNTSADVGGSGIIIPRNGRYQISGCLFVQSNDFITLRLNRQASNGNVLSILRVDSPAASSNRSIIIPATLVALNEGDTITYGVTNDCTLFLAAGHTEINIRRVG